MLELGSIVVHPGSAAGHHSREHAITVMAESLNGAHSEIPGVVTVLENMAGQGHMVSSITFQSNQLHRGVLEEAENWRDAFVETLLVMGVKKFLVTTI